MQKILFLFPHFLLPGGAAHTTIRFARGLQGLGYATEIICAGVAEHILRDNTDIRFTVLDIPKSNLLKYWAFFPFWQIRINRTLSKYKDSVLFSQVLPSNWWAWIFKLTHTKAKIVWYCQEPSAFIHSTAWIKAIQSPMMRWGALCCRPVLKKIDITLERGNDLVICNSRTTAQSYHRIYGRHAKAVIYPPSSVRIEEFIKGKKDYFFTVSRLSKFKNVDLLIRSFASIHKKFPDYSLVIAGAGEEMPALKKLAKSYPESRITFTGEITNSELANYYRHAQATILCSKDEPFGLVPVESMIHGTPVIAHKSGGPMETIIDSKTGFLFHDEEELSLLLEKMMTMDAMCYQEMQRAAQQQAKKFDIAVSLVQLENVLQSLLSFTSPS